MKRRKLTPLPAIRLTCYGCRSAGATQEIRVCQVTDCPLHEYRMGKRPEPGTAKLTPLRAIKEYYKQLCGGSQKPRRFCGRRHLATSARSSSVRRASRPTRMRG